METAPLLPASPRLSDADYEAVLKSVGHLSKGYLKPSLFLQKYAKLSTDMGMHEVDLESAYVRRSLGFFVDRRGGGSLQFTVAK